MEKDIYCICKKPYENGEVMIECSGCTDWFHGRCVGVSEEQMENIDKYFCPDCIIKFGPILYANKPVKTLTKLKLKAGSDAFIKWLENKGFYEASLICSTVEGEDLNENFLERTGFDKPIFIEKKDGLKMTMPPSHVNIGDIINLIGSERIIDVINVRNQTDFKMRLKHFHTYYILKNKTDIFNVISLEFSKTKLAEIIEIPDVVKQISWVDLYWPNSAYMDDYLMRPETLRYCLMSAKASYTDFHIDFSGTSVWYHIHQGEKIFYLIKPTDDNLRIYEKWLMLKNNKELFFSDYLIRQLGKSNRTQTYKMVLTAGNTVMIPGGWIHAVYTTKDSIVFGGNFLCTYRAEMHLKIYALEKRLNIENKYILPNFESLHWYTANSYVNTLIGGLYGEEMCYNDVVTGGMLALYKILCHWIDNTNPSYLACKRNIPMSVSFKKVLKELEFIMSRLGFSKEEINVPFSLKPKEPVKNPNQFVKFLPSLELTKPNKDNVPFLKKETEKTVIKPYVKRTPSPEPEKPKLKLKLGIKRKATTPIDDHTPSNSNCNDVSANVEYRIISNTAKPSPIKVGIRTIKRTKLECSAKAYKKSKSKEFIRRKEAVKSFGKPLNTPKTKKSMTTKELFKLLKIKQK
ncbi:JmjC domain-containing histone demethylation protein 1 [Intoshia linei]|uniref:JmjC domain-containing histone demethylation protein 1 n=1 Tax=Intoshia linei TaxID=1819745 RepID=A0A177B9T0_9BILA|nr:JmjC domain-containing histone demethylation protein 1 [Intoshia linei]